MGTHTVSRDSTKLVSLFQKAHGTITAVQRLDEQIASLFDQRRKALEDVRVLRGQINEEFERVLELGRVVPSDALSTVDLEPPLEPPIRRESREPMKGRLSSLESGVS